MKRNGMRLLSIVMTGALSFGMMPGLAYAASSSSAGGAALAAGSAALGMAQAAVQEAEVNSAVDWAHLYGGRGQGTTDTFSLNQVNSFENAVTLSDGSIVAAGVKAVRTADDKKNEWDASLVFYDAEGKQTREVVFGSQASDGFEKVIEAKDGSLIAVGYAGNGDGAFEGVVAKTDNSKTTDFDAVICKIDPATGVLTKAVAFGGTGKDMFRDVVQLDDGSFIAVGYESSQDGDMQGINKTSTRDALVMRFSSDLSESSVIDILGGTSSGMEEARCVIAGVDGGFAVAGTGFSNSGDFEGLSKADKKGDWFFAAYDAEGSSFSRSSLKEYGGSADDYLMGLDYDYQGEAGFGDSATGYVLVGYGKSTDGDFSTVNGGGAECAALMRVGADGTLKEVVGVGSAAKSYAEGILSFNGGYLVTGWFTGTLTAGGASAPSAGAEDAFASFVSKRDGSYVIDPLTALGGSGVDKARSASLGTGANLLLTGYTRSDEFAGAEAAAGTKSNAFICSIDLAQAVPASACATVPGATVSYGSSAATLIKGSIAHERAYAVPVSLVNASSDKPSMAAGMLAESAQLSLDAKGGATLRVTLGAVMGGFASDFKVYEAAAATGDTVAATVVATRKDADGNEVPLVIDIPVPAAAMGDDYVFINMHVGLMGSDVDARLKVDYANATLAKASDYAAAQEVSAKIAELPSGNAVTLGDAAAIERVRASYDALEAGQKAYVHATALSDAEKAIASLKAQKTIASVAVKSAGAVYTGSAIKPAVTVKAVDGSIVGAANYTVSYAGNVNAGTAKVKVSAKGDYTGSAETSFKIAKASAKVKKAVKLKTFKVKQLKSKKASFAAFSFATDGKVAYKVMKKDSKKVLTFKNGKVFVKKRAKAGTYSLQVKVSARAGVNYGSLAAKTYTIKVKVKK